MQSCSLTTFFCFPKSCGEIVDAPALQKRKQETVLELLCATVAKDGANLWLIIINRPDFHWTCKRSPGECRQCEVIGAGGARAGQVNVPVHAISTQQVSFYPHLSCAGRLYCG